MLSEGVRSVTGTPAWLCSACLALVKNIRGDSHKTSTCAPHSRAMAGVLTAETLEGRLDENGTDFLAAATAAGYGAATTQARPAFLLSRSHSGCNWRLLLQLM